VDQTEVMNLVTASIRATLDAKGMDGAMTYSVTPETKILGSNSDLDSLDLINLLMKIEEVVRERTGKEISLVDENSLSGPASPFLNAGTLTTHVLQKVEH
jgi:acyl carrier protein